DLAADRILEKLGRPGGRRAEDLADLDAAIAADDDPPAARIVLIAGPGVFAEESHLAVADHVAHRYPSTSAGELGCMSRPGPGGVFRPPGLGPLSVSDERASPRLATLAPGAGPIRLLSAGRRRHNGDRDDFEVPGPWSGSCPGGCAARGRGILTEGSEP